MIPHATACGCGVCRSIAERDAGIISADRMMLASMWEEWVSTTDGEATKLRAGENGAVGSPRWAALQAIAHARKGLGDPISAQIVRDTPVLKFAGAAAAINDSPHLMKIFAAPEWDCLSDDGQQWVSGLVRETMAQVVGGELSA